MSKKYTLPRESPTQSEDPKDERAVADPLVTKEVATRLFLVSQSLTTLSFEVEARN